MRPAIEQCLSGFYPALSYDDYDKDPALRHSVLNRFATSPRGSDIPTESPAMALGRVFHHLALTPKIPLPVDVKDVAMVMAAQEMAQAFRESSVARNLFPGAFCEASLFWDKDGISCKARLDLLAQTYVADLKTTRSLANFQNDALGYGYHRQGDWYLDATDSVMGITSQQFLLVAVEKKTNRIEVFEVTPAQLRAAKQQNALQLELFKRSVKDPVLWEAMDGDTDADKALGARSRLHFPETKGGAK